MKLTEEEDKVLKHLYYTDENAWREMRMELILRERKGIKKENPVTGDLWRDVDDKTYCFIGGEWKYIGG